MRRLGLVVVAACSGNAPSAHQICERAEVRLEACVVQELGSMGRDLQAKVHAKAALSIEQCERDAPTVAMYRACLDKPTCDELQTCEDDHANRPSHAAATPDAQVPRIELGAPGPPIAWSITAVVLPSDELAPAWGPSHTLVFDDADGLHGIRDGKPLWRATKHPHFVIVGGRIVTDELHDLHVLDATTGKEIATATVGDDIRSMAEIGDRAIVLDFTDDLYELDVGRCAPGRCAARRIGKVDGQFAEIRLDRWRDNLVVGTNEGAIVLDGRGKMVLELKAAQPLSGAAIMSGELLAMSDLAGVKLLALGACAKLGTKLSIPSTATSEPPATCAGCRAAVGDCIAASAAGGALPTLNALPGGSGVAFNDDREHTTRVLTPDVSWSTTTFARSVIAADDASLYVVSSVADGQPMMVLALARATGEVRWHAELPGAKASYVAHIAIRDGRLAITVGTTVYVVELPPTR